MGERPKVNCRREIESCEHLDRTFFSSLRIRNTPQTLIQVPFNLAALEEMKKCHSGSIRYTRGTAENVSGNDWPNQAVRLRTDQTCVKGTTFGVRDLPIGGQTCVHLVISKAAGLFDLVVQR